MPFDIGEVTDPPCELNELIHKLVVALPVGLVVAFRVWRFVRFVRLMRPFRFVRPDDLAFRPLDELVFLTLDERV